MRSVDEGKIGMVHVYTGNGPGKTRSALGIAMRALGHEQKVYIIQFMKGRWRGEEEFGEIKTANKLKGLHIARFGTGKFIEREETAKDVDRKLAYEGLKHAKEIINKGSHDIVVLDEINIAIHFGLLDLKEILSIIQNKPKHVELILTGRRAKDEIRETADYLIIHNAVKHPYRKGEKAREGIEY